MAGKIFLLMCTLAFLNPICPNPLTKEITAEQSSQLKFRNIIAQLEKTDILGDLFTLTFGNFEGIHSNLTNLLANQTAPDLSEVLAIFNNGFGKRVLFLNERYIQVDPNALDKLLTDRLWSITMDVLPKNYFPKLFVYDTLQKHIKNSVDELRPRIENRKISIEEINSKTVLDQSNIETRDLMSSLETAICTTLIESVYSQINETYTTVTEILSSITVGSSDNGLINALLSTVSFIINILQQTLDYIWELAESIESSICTTLLSSRKRRDLTFFEETIERSKRDTSLVEAEPQVMSSRSVTVIFGVVWSILATVLGYAITSMFALVSLSQVCPSPLTKEITADQSPQLQFRDILLEIEATDFTEVFSSFISSFQEIYLNLADLTQSENRPEISEVLNIFNNGLGARLLVVNGNYVQVDPSGVERLMSDKVKSTLRNVFPQDQMQQLLVYNFLQSDILRSGQKILSEIEIRKVPLETLSAAITEESIATRASNLSDFLTQLGSLLQTSVCNTVVSPIYTQLNSSLTSATSFLDSLTLSSTENVILSLLGNLVSLGVDLAKQAVSYIRELADTFVSSMCGTSSRKRRDLSFLQEAVESKRDTALAQVRSQAISVRSFNVIFALLVSLVAAVCTFAFVYLITGGISSIISLIFSFVFGSISSWVSSIFSSVFSIFSWF